MITVWDLWWGMITVWEEEEVEEVVEEVEEAEEQEACNKWP